MQPARLTMSQTLYLLRHAKAVPWSPGINDFERCLSNRGRRHMDHLSVWASQTLAIPDRCLCSSSARTRETIEPFFSHWQGLERNTEYLDEIYAATTGSLHSIAESGFQTADSIMMVGHNPGFEFLALALLRDQDANGITKMATGTMAVIEFPKTYERDSGEGILRRWVKRKDFSGD